MQKEKIDFEKLEIKSYNPMQKLLDKRFTLEAIVECLSFDERKLITLGVEQRC